MNRATVGLRNEPQSSLGAYCNKKTLQGGQIFLSTVLHAQKMRLDFFSNSFHFLFNLILLNKLLLAFFLTEN
jgi:hypothetical protein